jgi:hypothetical protein
MSQAIRTQGTTVKRGNGDGPPETFTNVAEVLDFDGPGGEASEIDVSHLESTSKEFLLGLKDNGELAINVNLIPGSASQNGLQADHDASTLRNFKLVLSQGTTAAFAAYVKRFRRTGQKDDVVKAAITLRITGDITWT